MSDDSSSLLEEERSLFRPFTRESRLAIEARIAEELEKQKELEKRRAEGEVSFVIKNFILQQHFSLVRHKSFHFHNFFLFLTKKKEEKTMILFSLILNREMK